MSSRSSSSFSDCSMPSLESLPLDQNGYRFVYNIFKAQGDNVAFNRLRQSTPTNRVGLMTPLNALQMVEEMENFRVPDLFKLMVSTNRVHVLKAPLGSPSGSMIFATDLATVVTQDSILRDVPHIGSYRAIITLVPRKDKETWVGTRVVRQEEEELELKEGSGWCSRNEDIPTGQDDKIPKQEESMTSVRSLKIDYDFMSIIY